MFRFGVVYSKTKKLSYGGWITKCHPDLARYQYLNQWIIDVAIGVYDSTTTKEKKKMVVDMKRPIY